MTPHGGLIAGLAASVAVVAQAAVDNGVTESTGWAIGALTTGAAVYLYLDRRTQSRDLATATLRRAEDQRLVARSERLEDDLKIERAEHIRVIKDERDHHRTEVKALNERIFELLNDRSGR